MKKLFKLTQQGIDNLKDELANLILKRPQISEAIRLARELGDLAENAEYQSAREDQTRNENRIEEIEAILQNTELIQTSKSKDKVMIGSKIKLKSSTGKIKEFQIVGTVEADPLNGKISDESPIGSILLNKHLNEEVILKTSQEETKYKIIEIS